MKALITATGQYGPFTSIEKSADRWVCDGAEYQFSVIGDATVGEYVAPPPAPPSRDTLKANRAAAVDAIIVTTSTGKAFNGDEVSQNRMARGILGLQAAGAPSVTWVLADNTATTVTVAELGEALALAGAAQAAIWVIP